MKHVVIAVVLSLALVAPAHAASAIALWGTPKYPATFPHFDYVNPNAPKGGTIKLSTNAAFDSMNPFILKGVGAPGVAGYVYQSLMTPSYDEPQSYYPLIASSITLAPDRSRADFALNPKARWSDGKPLTSADVVWSFNTLKSKGHPSLKVQYKPITIEALGPHAVRFHFADKTHRELPLIAASLPVLPQHYFCAQEEAASEEEAAPVVPPPVGGRLGGGRSEAPLAPITPPPQPSPYGGGGAPVAPSPLTTHDSPRTTTSCIPFEKTTLALPIGSGPYTVSNVEPGRSITFARDKAYWGADLPSQRGLNNFDTIRIDVYRDDTVALEGIKSHQFDFYEEFIARNWATAYNTPAVKSGALIKTLIPNKIPRGMQGFLFNTREPKFADRRVREAIGLTLDYEWMNRVLFYGAYERSRSFFGNTEFEAKGLPDADELRLLQPFRGHKDIPPPVGDASRHSPVTSKEDATSGENPPYINAATSSVVPPPVGGRLGGGRQMAASQPITPPPQPSPYGGGGTARAVLPESIFTSEYTVPTTDGSGIARANLIRAQQLLNDAGWVMRNGVRVNEKTGEPLTVEFLMHQRTFERVVGIMRANLKKLGVESSFRYVDASQYQKRVEKKQFDVISIWWNLGLFYPSTEQYLYWHSSQADIEGSQNLAGVKNPAIDSLVERIQAAQTLPDLRSAARALDRVLTHEYYVLPHWSINAWRVAYWDQFGRPEITPAYNLGTDTWWAKDAPAQKTEGAP